MLRVDKNILPLSEIQQFLGHLTFSLVTILIMALRLRHCKPRFQLAITTLLYVKAIPLQAWTGPEGSRRLRLPDFKTIGT
jgi:hypothetical protein